MGEERIKGGEVELIKKGEREGRRRREKGRWKSGKRGKSGRRRSYVRRRHGESDEKKEE